MPRINAAPPAPPPLIDSDGALRSILLRADANFELRAGIRRECGVAELQSFSPLGMAPATPEAIAPSQPAAWADAVADAAGRLQAGMPSFVLGFSASLAVAVMVLASVPEIIAPAAGPAAVAVAVEAQSTGGRLAAFAAAGLPLFAADGPAPVALKVAGEIAAEVGRSVPFPLSVEATQNTVTIRIGALPRYAGLSAGVPQDGGGWLVDRAAVPGLKLTAYAAQPLPQEIDIELIGDDGKALASARTRVTVSAGPEASIGEAPPAVEGPAASLIVPAARAVPISVAAVPEPEAASVPLAPASIPAALPRPATTAMPQVRSRPARPRSVAVTGKATSVAPKPAGEPKSVASANAVVARALRAKPAPPVPATVATAAPAVMMPSRLPWSYRWMRSTLGMGNGGP